MYDIGWNHPLFCKSAGHKIPFCSHCHLLVPSRFVDKSGREGRARNHGLRPRSLDKLAKPLRWFQLKLAVLPVGFINSELAQTLTSMGELFPPGPTIQKPPLSGSLAFPPYTLSSASPLHFTTESSNWGSQTSEHSSKSPNSIMYRVFKIKSFLVFVRGKCGVISEEHFPTWALQLRDVMKKVKQFENTNMPFGANALVPCLRFILSFLLHASQEGT